MVLSQGPDEGAEAAQPAACDANAQHRPVRLSWARLLEHCPNGGGELKILAAILEPVCQKNPTHPGLQARAPPRACARGHTLLLAA